MSLHSKGFTIEGDSSVVYPLTRWVCEAFGMRPRKVVPKDGEYSEEIPQAKRMGDYTIYYYVKATDTDNYVDSEVYELKSSIGGPARDLWDLIIEAQTYLAYMQTLTPQTSKLRAAEKTLTTALNAAKK